MSVDVLTFGCRLNAFESEVIAREAERAGLSDTVVINSCAVTNEAVAQARQSIRRLKRERPDVRIVVTGCAAQTQAEMFADMAEVDRVVGNDDKMRGEAWRDARAAFDDWFWYRRQREDRGRRHHGGAARWRRICWMVSRRACRGCSCRCRTAATTAAPSASFPTAAAIRARCRWARCVDQVRALAERGHAEIVLTGVDLTSYGADLPGSAKARATDKTDLAPRAGIEAPADFVDRFRSRPTAICSTSSRTMNA